MDLKKGICLADSSSTTASFAKRLTEKESTLDGGRPLRGVEYNLKESMSEALRGAATVGAKQIQKK